MTSLRLFLAVILYGTTLGIFAAGVDFCPGAQAAVRNYMGQRPAQALLEMNMKRLANVYAANNVCIPSTPGRPCIAYVGKPLMLAVRSRNVHFVVIWDCLNHFWGSTAFTCNPNGQCLID